MILQQFFNHEECKIYYKLCLFPVLKAFKMADEEGIYCLYTSSGMYHSLRLSMASMFSFPAMNSDL